MALWRFWPAALPEPSAGLSLAEREAYYASPLPPLPGPVPVYHLGHSLVGRDMPAMLAQLAGHKWHSQLGWGASLEQHLKGDVPGFAEENASAAFRPAGEAIDSGDYPVVVLTEMIGLREAILWHDAPGALRAWVKRIRAAAPQSRIYLYETWHPLDEGGDIGWAARIRQDLPGYWEGYLLRAVLSESEAPVWLIPGGQVMAAFDQAAKAGTIPGFDSAEALFSDQIHFNDFGAYLMALTHYAVIYGRNPLGLPHRMFRADGGPAAPLSAATAEAMQRLVWQVVQQERLTGVTPDEGGPRAEPAAAPGGE